MSNARWLSRLLASSITCVARAARFTGSARLAGIACFAAIAAVTVAFAHGAGTTVAARAARTPVALQAVGAPVAAQAAGAAATAQAAGAAATAQAARAGRATGTPSANAPPRAVFVDAHGVLRSRDSGAEFSAYGANYCIMSGSDYRMTALVGGDRKAMIDEDMAHFARMGWQALRLCSWGDWENSDAAGNLIVNEHVELLDYLIAAARKRGIYMLLTPIHTYDPAFADQLGKPSSNTGFSRYFQRPEMGTNAKSIAAQANYIRQLLEHVNPYTGVAIKDETAIPFIEVINEPIHHPENLTGSIRYINELVSAVRATGSKQITFFNVSQDFAISTAIERSTVDGVSFGWYPTSLVAGHTLSGNFLPAVDGYPDMLRSDLARRPRIVYEFDQADLLSGYLYPAMARIFRSVGAQFATMFAYDMLRTAPYNLSWQTHYLNLVHTPRKAVSAVIAAEAMKRLPRLQSYGHYPANRSFGDFKVDADTDSSELNAPDVFMNAGPIGSSPRDPKLLRRVVGFDSSKVVTYEGAGAYFLDRVRKGVWRLEVYPDEILVRDPFEQPRPDKVVSRLLYRQWPMTVRLPDLGADFHAVPINVPHAQQAHNATFTVEPGVWVLSKDEDVKSLPAAINGVSFDEYHVNERTEYPDLIQSLAPAEFPQGTPADIRVRVANTTLPDQVRLWIRPAGTRNFHDSLEMTRLEGNDYHVGPRAPVLPAGLYEFVVNSRTGDRKTTFPGGATQEPGEWPFQTDTLWTFRVVPPDTPLRLLNPKSDAAHLSFVRPGEQYRNPFFQVILGETSDESALCLTLPDLGRDSPDRYAADLYIGNLVGARSAEATRADSVMIKLRAAGGAHKTVDVTLIEKDGSSWTAPVTANSEWTTVTIPLGTMRTSRSILIPSPYPGLWNYWRPSPTDRGQNGDHFHAENAERLQLTVYPNSGSHTGDDASAVVIESVRLHFVR